MFAVDGFVNTFSPCALKSATRSWVVELFPALPEITTRPIGAESMARLRRFGSMKAATVPGKAEPPPRRTLLSKNLAVFPTNTARKLRI
jgi:hypothetical protein